MLHLLLRHVEARNFPGVVDRECVGPRRTKNDCGVEGAVGQPKKSAARGRVSAAPAPNGVAVVVHTRDSRGICAGIGNVDVSSRRGRTAHARKQKRNSKRGCERKIARFHDPGSVFPRGCEVKMKVSATPLRKRTAERLFVGIATGSASPSPDSALRLPTSSRVG